MNPSAVAVIATLSSLYGPQEDRRMDRRQFFRVTGGAVDGVVAAGLLAHPLMQAAVLDRPEGLILPPGAVTEPILFKTEMYDLARQFAMLCGQRWVPNDVPAVREMQSKILRRTLPVFTRIEQLPRIASMDDETVETGIAIDPVTGLTARASRSLVRTGVYTNSTTPMVQLEIIGQQDGRGRVQ